MKILIALALVALASANAFASDNIKVVSPTVTINFSKLAGMYWYSFKNGFVGGHKDEEYIGTDVLELVPYDKDSMYFRADLSFFNGHSCGIYGIAERDGERLTYYDITNGNGCVLHVVPTSTSITLDDPTGKCQNMSCGARGSYGGENFSPKRKKKITYLEKLLNSWQYQEAVRDYQLIKAAKTKGIEPQWANAKAMLGTYAFWGNIDGVKNALSQGASLEFTEKQGWGPIAGAGYRRNIEITQMMLDYGLDINQLENGETLLTRAAYNGSGQPGAEQQFTYIKWLLEKGADPRITNSEGKKALDIAIMTQADKLVLDLLKKQSN